MAASTICSVNTLNLECFRGLFHRKPHPGQRHLIVLFFIKITVCHAIFDSFVYIYLIHRKLTEPISMILFKCESDLRLDLTVGLTGLPSGEALSLSLNYSKFVVPARNST